MSFSFRGLSFDLEGEAVDDDIYQLFWLQSRDESRSQLKFQLRVRALQEQSFDRAVAYWRKQEVDALTDVRVLERTSMTLAGTEARIYVHAATAADGTEACVLVALFKCAEEVVVLSSVGHADDGGALMEAFETVLKGITPENAA